MTPLFRSIMPGATAWLQWKTPRRLMSMTRSNCSSVILTRRASCVMPALLTSTSMRPCFSWTLATTASMVARSVTSMTWPSASAPRARHCCTTASMPVGLMSQTMTMAPSVANLRAVASPMPWAAPVMRLTLPARRPSGVPWGVGLDMDLLRLKCLEAMIACFVAVQHCLCGGFPEGDPGRGRPAQGLRCRLFRRAAAPGQRSREGRVPMASMASDRPSTGALPPRRT